MKFHACLSLLLVVVSATVFAETKAECEVRCATEKVQRDNACPPPSDLTDVARAQCLQDSSKEYASCKKSCPAKTPESPAPGQ